MPMYGSNSLGIMRRSMRNIAPVGAGVALPTALSGNLGRWDGYSGIVADATNGGFKWNPESGSSVLQSVSGTGPDYSATGLSGRPAMLLSTGKSLITSPAINVGALSGQFLFMAVLQLAPPATVGVVFAGNTNGSVAVKVTANGSISIERANQVVIATTPAGSFPFNTPVLLTYEYNNGPTVKHIVRINKVLQTTTGDTVSGTYSSAANVLQIGRQLPASSASDLVGFVSYVDLGSTAVTGTTLTDYEAAIYQRYVA